MPGHARSTPEWLDCRRQTRMILDPCVPTPAPSAKQHADLTPEAVANLIRATSVRDVMSLFTSAVSWLLGDHRLTCERRTHALHNFANEQSGYNVALLASLLTDTTDSTALSRAHPGPPNCTRSCCLPLLISKQQPCHHYSDELLAASYRQIHHHLAARRGASKHGGFAVGQAGASLVCRRRSNNSWNPRSLM